MTIEDTCYVCHHDLPDKPYSFHHGPLDEDRIYCSRGCLVNDLCGYDMVVTKCAKHNSDKGECGCRINVERKDR